MAAFQELWIQEKTRKTWCLLLAVSFNLFIVGIFAYAITAKICNSRPVALCENCTEALK